MLENAFQFDAFLNLFDNKNSEKYKLFEEIYNLSKENYEILIEKLKPL